MLLFCPSCSNTLIITRIPRSSLPPSALADANTHRFECRTCPYQMLLDKKYFDRRTFAFKQVDDILGGEEAWRSLQRTEVNCPNPQCEGKEAFFKQMQTRSADEPMTSIYKCVECSHQWREG